MVNMVDMDTCKPMRRLLREEIEIIFPVAVPVSVGARPGEGLADGFFLRECMGPGQKVR